MQARDAPLDDVTRDAVLGGRLTLLQPARGHRVGHDAILLAAACPAAAGDRVVDFGAGIGSAGLALARRVPGTLVTLVEIVPQLAGLAADNAVANGLADRVQAVTLDVGANASAWTEAGLPPGSADHVLMNPPFNDPARQQSSPAALRALAHVAPAALLERWLKAASRLLQPRGTVTLIWRADGLADVLAALAPSFGGICVQPIYPAPEAAAIRVIVHGRKGSRGPLAVSPALVLNDALGQPTQAAQAVLRDAAALSPAGRK